MKKITLFLILAFTALYAKDIGHVQIMGDPGLAVFIDSVYVGQTGTEYGGLIVQNIEVGDHELKVVKEGYSPQVKNVTIGRHQIVLFEVSPFTPQVEITQSGEKEDATIKRKIGRLKVITLPIAAIIEIPKLGINKDNGGNKEKQNWEASKIPEGKYSAVFRSGLKKINYNFEIKQNTTTELFVNFVIGGVIDISSVSEVSDQMALVMGGTFNMGDGRDEGDSDEKPVHAVTLSSFYICKYEVTQKDWLAVMGDNPSVYRGDDMPVDKVSWLDAIHFCNKKSQLEGLKPCYSILGTVITCDFRADGYRLLTEAEWEYAARGGEKSRGLRYSGSDNPAEVAWYSDNSDNQTHPVGLKQANELGLFDMSGNVWEWCWDRYEPYSQEPRTDPQGAETGNYRVRRGGSWLSQAQHGRVANRYLHNPSYSFTNVGFRICRSAE